MTLNKTGSSQPSSSNSSVVNATTRSTTTERRSTLPVAVTQIDSEMLNGFSHSKRVGNYMIGRTIGEGSFAKVKEALHVVTGEVVAVKIINKKKALADPYVKRNLHRESKLLQHVRHRNIVQLFDVMETESSYYLVMEYCSGGDLLERIYVQKCLDEMETRRYIRQIVSAVEYMHRAGVIHRDLKVENLLLDENKEIKIIDFGLSNSIRLDSSIISVGNIGPLANDGSVAGVVSGELCTTQCGSPAYAAPELLNNKKYGPKVDIWSIGVNMFAMLTGNLPFTVEPFTIRALHSKMIKGEMNGVPDHLSKGCRDLLQRFLTADPDRRITLQQAMHHPWLIGKKPQPIQITPFPNRLRALDLSQSILVYMAQKLDFRLSDIIHLVTSNSPSGATAVYFLLQRRLDRYQRRGTTMIDTVQLPNIDAGSSSAASSATTSTVNINIPAPLLGSDKALAKSPEAAAYGDVINQSAASRDSDAVFISVRNNSYDVSCRQSAPDDVVADALDDVINIGHRRHSLQSRVSNSDEDDVMMTVTYRDKNGSLDYDCRHGMHDEVGDDIKSVAADVNVLSEVSLFSNQVEPLNVPSSPRGPNAPTGGDVSVQHADNYDTDNTSANAIGTSRRNSTSRSALPKQSSASSITSGMPKLRLIGRHNVRTVPRRRHANAATGTRVVAVANVRASFAPIRSKGNNNLVGGAFRQHPPPRLHGRYHQPSSIANTLPQGAPKTVELPILRPAHDEVSEHQQLMTGVKVTAGEGRPYNGSVNSISPISGRGRSKSFYHRPSLETPCRQTNAFAQLRIPRPVGFLLSPAAGNNGGNDDAIADETSSPQVESMMPSDGLITGNVDVCKVVELKFAGRHEPEASRVHSQYREGAARGVHGYKFKRQSTVVGGEPSVGGYTILPPLSARRSFEH